MKKFSTLFLLLVFAGMYCTAQNKIAVEYNGTSTFYDRLDTAVANAPSGATVYIPGGGYNIGTLTISKKLNLIGLGHNPDSTLATSFTNVTGNIWFRNGADYSSVTGIYLSGYIQTHDNVGDYASNILIKRCNVNIITIYSQNSSSFSDNVVVDECIVRSGIGGSLASGAFVHAVINNCIVVGYILWLSGSTISNNILFGSVYVLSQSSDNIVQNNIFLTQVGNVSNFFYNNYTSNATNIFSGATLDQNNHYNVTDLFVNQSGTTFSYTQDYHLTPTSPARNGGTDGTDAGVYGGTNPWKEGSVPFNPHIILQSIPNTTDANGNLNVNIKVGAQDH